jgi:hypothetical protein
MWRLMTSSAHMTAFAQLSAAFRQRLTAAG